MRQMRVNKIPLGDISKGAKKLQRFSNAIEVFDALIA
jgi:hypothetical protein